MTGSNKDFKIYKKFSEIMVKKNEAAFTLIETMVVLTLISALTLVGMTSIVHFRSETALDNITNELISEIRSARSKSMNGELLTGESENTFKPDGFPEYGITISGDTYKLVRKCIKVDSTTCEEDPAIESINIGSEYRLSPDDTFYFERISGISDNVTITLTDKSGVTKRIIMIPDNFDISVIKS